MSVLIRRVCTHPVNGTNGVLIIDGIPICVTLEPTWRNNEPNISCIPAGVYECKRVLSQKYGDTIEVTGVPGRSHILFHAGNKTADTKGCILLGEKFSKVSTDRWILESKSALTEFRQAIGWSTSNFTLTIENAYSIF